MFWCLFCRPLFHRCVGEWGEASARGRGALPPFQSFLRLLLVLVPLLLFPLSWQFPLSLMFPLVYGKRRNWDFEEQKHWWTANLGNSNFEEQILHKFLKEVWGRKKIGQIPQSLSSKYKNSSKLQLLKVAIPCQKCQKTLQSQFFKKIYTNPIVFLSSLFLWALFPFPKKSGVSSCAPHFLQMTCWCWRRCIWGAARCHESTEQIESSVRLVFLSLFRLGFLCMGVVILGNLSWETVVQQHISFYLRAGVFRSPLDLTRKQV